MRILFVGESWKGSSARSMREALTALPDVQIDEVNEDRYLPKSRARLLRAMHRVLAPLHHVGLRREISARLMYSKPDVLLVYKGTFVSAQLVSYAKSLGIFTVNVFPDLSPRNHGCVLKEAIGEYELVVSTKVFHPNIWRSIYGYSNRCIFVPHGYDPTIHSWSELPSEQDIDVVLAATWRPEYNRLMREFSDALGETQLKVQIAGSGWPERAKEFPSGWTFSGAVRGRGYSELLRRAKIAIAPVTTDVVIDGVHQPADEDTTRTYELAAAQCFFLHRRTEYVQSIYDERTEVPMWDTPQELAVKVLDFLPLEAERRAMAARAHLRAVPNYSIPTRALQVFDNIIKGLERRRNGSDEDH